jgi:hypothetical protein
MNRHERRAAKAATKPATETAASSSGIDITFPGGLPSSSNIEIDLSPDLRSPTHQRPIIRNEESSFLSLAQTKAGATAPSAHEKPKAGLGMRLFSALLLSRFVLKRVKQPEVERLLMSVALEAGRQDVVDELTRRDALRSGPIILS